MPQSTNGYFLLNICKLKIGRNVVCSPKKKGAGAHYSSGSHGNIFPEYLESED